MQLTLQSKKIIEIFLICSFSLTLLITILIPYGSVFVSTERMENDSWQWQYLWNDLILSLIYFPLIAIWIAYLFVRNQNFKAIAKVILIIFSIFSFLMAVGAATILAQDFQPYYGVFTALLILPIAITYILYLRFQKIRKRNSR